MTTTLIILVVSAVLFVSGKMRSDLVAVLVMLALLLTGILTPAEALAGFSNPIVIMMVGLFVVGGGVFSTGLAKKIGGQILSLSKGNETRLFILLMLTTSFVGAFVSNTGTVALMLPIVVSMARAGGLSASRLLMPLAFAGSMGGMLTLIGTPPNLIISEELVKAGYAPLSFFSFTPVGIITIVVGVLVLLPLTKIFLAGRDKGDDKKARGKSLDQLTEEYRIAENLTRLVVTAGSKIVGQTVRSLNIRNAYSLNVIEVRRISSGRNNLLKKVTQYAVTEVELQEGDVIYVRGTVEDTERFRNDFSLKIDERKEENKKHLHFYDVGMAEVLLLPSSTMIGRTIQEAGFRADYGLNVLGVRRRDNYILKNLKDVRLHDGDVVLVQGAWENIARIQSKDTEWVVLGQPLEQASKVTLDYKAPLAAFIMLLMVAAMAFDFIPMEPVTAVILAGVLMVLSGCLRNVEQAIGTINWESIILFGAMLPMSTALEKTGASEMISGGMVDFFGGGSPYLLLAGIYAVTSLMTLFISNTVTAVLMAPIAISAALQADVNPVSFLFAVAVAASMCFASPFSTPPNALVMAAGNYKPIDYIRVGLPLQIIMGIVMIFALPLLFPFK